MKNSLSKISIARIPTPITQLHQLSSEWNVDLRVKNDNLTEAELSGNKVRKLEYLLADALDQQCDTVITCGATTSNHARATAIAARRQGMETVLILAGDRPSFAHGNLQLDLLVGSHVKYISWQEYTENLESHLESTADELRRQGKKPYVIPTGGSNAVGLLGYVEAAEEIKSQCDSREWRPDYIVCAVGSGGTYSGLYLGNSLLDLTESVLGVLVCGTIDAFSKKIEADIRESCQKYGMKSPCFDKISLLDQYIGEGYAKTNAEQLKLIRYVAGIEGVILDPVYTGKTFYGMYREIRKGTIQKQSKVLFIHTGGIYGLSAFSEKMHEVWPQNSFWNAGSIIE